MLTSSPLIALPKMAPRYELGIATREDDAALRNLFRRTPMGEGIEVSLEREPSYMAALEIQGDLSETGVVRDTRDVPTIVGCGTRTVRDGYLNGRLTRIGYLGDMRLDPAHRNGTLAARLYRLMKSRDNPQWCDWYYTVIFEENTKALASLAKGRAGLPVYHSCGRLLCPGIELRSRRPALTVAGTELRSATRQDIPEIVACLNRNLSRRQFAAAYSAEHFQGSPRTRGLRAEDFRVAVKGGRIVGVMAAWDQSSFKQTRIAGYHGRWRWLAPLSRLAAPLRGVAGLPRPGQCLSYFYICCIAVDANDVDIFRALLRMVYNEHTGGRWLYFMIGLHESDPFVPVLQEYPYIPFAGRLFAVTLNDVAQSAPPALETSLVPSIEVATL